MAWSFLQSASVFSSTSSLAVAYSTANLSSGSKLICAVCDAGGNTGTVTVSDGTNSFNQLLKIGPLANNNSTFWFFELDTPAGDVGTKPTITASGVSSAGAAMLIQEVSGLATGTTATQVLDGTAGTTSGNEAASGSFSPSAPTYSSSVTNEYLVNIYFDDGDNVNTISTYPTGYTKDASSISGRGESNLGFVYGNSTGGAETGGTYTISSTSGNYDWARVLVAFKLVASGPAPARVGPIPPSVHRSVVTVSRSGWQGAGHSR